MVVPTEDQILEQFPGEPRWFRTLIQFRFFIAGIYLFTLAITLASIGIMALENWKPGEALFVFGFVLAAFLTQALLLAGAPKLRRSRPTRRRNKFVSLGAGALGAAVLTLGFVGTITSLSHHTFEWIEIFGESFHPLFVLIGGPWLFWFIVFGRLWFSEWTVGFGRMYRILLAGTFAELMFTVPVDVMVRRRTNCYCEEGTFIALIAGVTMSFWTFGPGVVLLFLAVRAQRRPRAHACLKCGYDLRGLPHPRCPECGLAFERNAVSPQIDTDGYK